MLMEGCCADGGAVLYHLMGFLDQNISISITYTKGAGVGHSADFNLGIENRSTKLVDRTTDKQSCGEAGDHLTFDDGSGVLC